jgi:hypothetical protein
MQGAPLTGGTPTHAEGCVSSVTPFNDIRVQVIPRYMGFAHPEVASCVGCQDCITVVKDNMQDGDGRMATETPGHSA